MLEALQLDAYVEADGRELRVQIFWRMVRRFDLLAIEQQDVPGTEADIGIEAVFFHTFTIPKEFMRRHPSFTNCHDSAMITQIINPH